MDITIKSNIVDNIVDIINALCEKFGIALDWSAENILPKVKELISRFAAYRISVYSACLIIAAILVAIFYKMWYKIRMDIIVENTLGCLLSYVSSL